MLLLPRVLAAAALLACTAAAPYETPDTWRQAAAKNKGSPDDIDDWESSSTVEVVDFRDEKVRERIKNRGPGAPPLVIKNALSKWANKKFGNLQELVKYGKLKVLNNLLMGNGGTMGGVKVNHKSTLFSYWDNSIQWLDRETMDDQRKQWPFHKWKFDNNMPLKKFMKAFNKNTTPHLYWQQDVPPDIMGINPRPALCKRVSMTAHEDICANDGSAGTMWLNSNGQIAQAHFDREFSMFVQLRAQKRWTLFSPKQLGDLCLYPYFHPALRQSQANLGNGAGAECKSAKGLHNRSVVLDAGDILIVAPYHVHRVEAIGDSISYSFPFDSQEKLSHAKVGDVFHKEIYYPVMTKMTEDSVGSGSMYSNAAMDDAVTSLRIVLRYVLTTLLVSKEDTKDFLKQHWTSDIQTLPDADKLESGKVSAEHMCQAEQALPKKRQRWLAGQAKKFVKGWAKCGLPSFLEEETLRYVIGTVITLAHGSIHPTAGLFIGTISAAGEGKNLMQSTQMLPWGDTKAWYDTLYRCNALQGELGKDEL